jgi:hypothetical protein
MKIPGGHLPASWSLRLAGGPAIDPRLAGSAGGQARPGSAPENGPAAATIPILDDHPVDLKFISGALGFEDHRAPGRPIDARKLPGQVVGWLERLSVKSSSPRFTRE